MFLMVFLNQMIYELLKFLKKRYYCQVPFETKSPDVIPVAQKIESLDTIF